MATKKGLMTMPRRVWRMTPDAPQGEYLELVPKEVQVEASEATRRPSPSDRPTAYGAVSLPSGRSDATQSTPPTRENSHATPSNGPPARPDEVAESPSLPPMRTRVLKPAQVESWQSSSFDLITGCSVREVTDTIPGELFDELFGPSGAATPETRRRR